MKLDFEKYNKQITLICPTCGSVEFKIESQEGIMMECKNCGLNISKDELKLENGEYIQAEINEIKNEVKKDIAKSFRDMLKKSFTGKYVKVK